MNLLHTALRITARTGGEPRCEFVGDAWGRTDTQAAGIIGAYFSRSGYWTLENDTRPSGVQQ